MTGKTKKVIYYALYLLAIGIAIQSIITHEGNRRISRPGQWPDNLPPLLILLIVFLTIYGSYKFPNKKYMRSSSPTLSPKSIDWFEKHGGSKIWQIAIFIVIAIFFVWNFISFSK